MSEEIQQLVLWLIPVAPLASQSSPHCWAEAAALQESPALLVSDWRFLLYVR